MAEPCGCKIVNRNVRANPDYAIEHCPTCAAAGDMLAALVAISGTPEQQLAYLHERDQRAPDTRYDKGDAAQVPQAYELALIHEDDARGYFPAQLDLIDAVAKHAAAEAAVPR